MTPLEELQTAHKRLSDMKRAAREVSPGRWMRDPEPESRVVDITSSHGAVAECYRESDADLIVTLHRTIDAQLAILARAGGLIAAAEHLNTGSSRDSVIGGIEAALSLARAITGEAS